MSELGALFGAGRYVELEAKLRRVVVDHPDSGLAWKALGVSLRMQGKDALHALERAANLLPLDAEALVNLGNARFDLGDFAEAARSYRAALTIAPEAAEVHDNLGNALRRLGQYDAAVACYREALRIKPGFVEAHNNLGNAWFALGQFEAAAASYGRVLEVKADSPEAHNNLGNALRSLGRFDAAMQSYRRALSLDPNFAAAHSNSSDALRDLGQPAAAVAASRRAIEIDPRIAGTHNTLGNALLDLGRLDDAAAAYRRALELDPRLTAASINLGLVLRQQGSTAEAEASCRRALELNPRSAPAAVLLAEISADRGEFGLAEEALKLAVASDPHSPEGWAGLAHLRKMTRDDAAWMAQAQAVAERALPPRQEAQLRFAIGKYCDDVGDFDQAFASYRRANELTQRYCAPYDRRHTDDVGRLIRRYDREWANRPRPAANRSARPVFIVGMPRSGTTLGEQILASHPAVFGAGELGFWTAAANSTGTPSSELADEYLRQLARLSADALRVVDKMPANFLALGLIHDALPNARIIHMRRNPIDTCLSIYFQDFRAAHPYSRDLDDLAHYYSEYRRIMDHWRRILPGHVLLDVPYEQLVSDQEAWSRRMLEFIGLPWDPRCIEFHETRRSVMSASKWQVRQRMHASSVERWRHYEKFLGSLRGLEP